MNTNNYFWQDVLTKGAILGAVMLVSGLVETAAIAYWGTAGAMKLVALEMVAALAVYIWLMCRFTKRYAAETMARQSEVKMFSFGQGLGYVVAVAVFAGIVVQLGEYLFIHAVIGYDTYLDRIVTMYGNLLSEVEMPASMADFYEQMLKQIRSQRAPSLISTLLSGVWSYLLRGTLLGLIIAGPISHRPKIDE